MDLRDLEFSYPEAQVAVEPAATSRILWVPLAGLHQEISKQQLFQKIQAGDVFVVNKTKVLRRRVFSNEGFEILFIKDLGNQQWETLFPASRLKKNQTLHLPNEVTLKLLQGGRPQVVEVNKVLKDEYFETYGELPLPPYIQKARNQRNMNERDSHWYQTKWAEKPGSLASPTASLHFTAKDLESLRAQKVEVVDVILHVGLGTFLPIATDKIEDHQMHEEYCEVPLKTWEIIQNAKRSHKKVWALGTTVTRTLESAAQGLLAETAQGFAGQTRIFIYPGYQFAIVDYLLTNFHQPQTTLLALLAAFCGKNRWQKPYEWAIKSGFRLFSYGDLSVWEKSPEHSQF